MFPSEAAGISRDRPFETSSERSNFPFWPPFTEQVGRKMIGHAFEVFSSCLFALIVSSVYTWNMGRNSTLGSAYSPG